MRVRRYLILPRTTITQPNLLTIFFCSIALCFSEQVCATPPQKPGDIQIEKKSFETKAGKVIKYELGPLFVPENRSDPKSRVIGIGFARFRATVKTPTATVSRISS